MRTKKDMKTTRNCSLPLRAVHVLEFRDVLQEVGISLHNFVALVAKGDFRGSCLRECQRATFVPTVEKLIV